MPAPAPPRPGTRPNPCPRGHQMRLQSVQASTSGYRQWVCDTCGHHGIPLPVRR